MKKLILAIFTMLFVSTAMFAQSDLQVLAVVKLNKSESITLKQLKKRANYVEKLTGQKLTVDDRNILLNTMIEEKLLEQAAAKDGISIPDSAINQQFEQQISQLIGAPVLITERQFDELVKEQKKMTSDEFLKSELGYSKAEYKALIKTQAMMELYIGKLKEKELKNVAPSPDEIKMYYQNNKQKFVQTDSVLLLRVDVPFDNDKKAAQVKINELKNKLIDKKVTADTLVTGSQVEGSGYLAEKGVLPKNESGARALGYSSMSMENFYKLLGQGVGYVSDVIETEASYSFVSILKKYNAKMLELTDPVFPESSETVLEAIKNQLTYIKGIQFLQQAMLEVADSLNTPENVEMKKSGDALTELLNWGE